MMFKKLTYLIFTFFISQSIFSQTGETEEIEYVYEDYVTSFNSLDTKDKLHYGFELGVSFSNSCNNNCSGTTDIEEYTTNKELLKTIDLLGRETKQTNQPLFYIYDDGTVEKRIVIE